MTTLTATNDSRLTDNPVAWQLFIEQLGDRAGEAGYDLWLDTLLVSLSDGFDYIILVGEPGREAIRVYYEEQRLVGLVEPERSRVWNAYRDLRRHRVFVERSEPMCSNRQRCEYCCLDVVP